MKRFPELVKMMEVARERHNEGDLRAAMAEFDRLEEAAAKAGVRSAALLRRKAVTLEALGREEEAFRAACEAVMIDPVDSACQERFNVLSSRLRERLASHTGEGGLVPRLYGLLSGVGETDATSHLALARFYLTKDDERAALKLLEAVTLLQPATAEAWTLRAEVALLRGDAASAESFSLRARATHTACVQLAPAPGAS